jgi:hypothetical protein
MPELINKGPGLAGTKADDPHPFNQFPKHLYDKKGGSIVANSAAEETQARARGFTETYFHQDFPKHLHRHVMDPKDNPRDPQLPEVVETREVANKKEEEAARAEGFGDAADLDHPHKEKGKKK